MIDRYTDKTIADIWTHESKLARWREVELAVILARENLGRIPKGTQEQIAASLVKIDEEFVNRWLEKEKANGHDLAAFVELEQDSLPANLRQEFHKDMTSFDTEEPAFAAMLEKSVYEIVNMVLGLLRTVKTKALEYRFVPMLGRTHCRTAEIQSFGRRWLTWYVNVKLALEKLENASIRPKFSKLSGALGTGSGIDPELEEVALRILGLKPFVGATQIMPRAAYTQVADALADFVSELEKIGIDIRLGTRDPFPLWNEPFGKNQKGSSAMPHKKNPISSEKVAGMARLARAYASAIKEGIPAWEERDISQSSVERVSWPDLLHVTAHALSAINKVLEGLVVYPANMLREICSSGGTYAASKAKTLIAEWLAPHGLDAQVAYRIVQLAASNVFECPQVKELLFRTLNDADSNFDHTLAIGNRLVSSIEDIICGGALRPSRTLDANAMGIAPLNATLQQVFADKAKRTEWASIFHPSYWLRNEAEQFKTVFGI